MFEHPYSGYQVTEFDQERIARAAEHRRVLIERADQIVPHPEGALRRMLRRLLGSRHSAGSDAAAERRAPQPCEPIPAR